MLVRLRYLVLLLVFLVGGCPRPAALLGVPATGPSALADREITGRVLLPARSTQAYSVADDVAAGATVSLIDTQTQVTVGSTVTTASGSFRFSFGASFKPDSARAYYLEAIKGIKGPNGQYNQVGAEAVRLRTLLYYRDGWVSLTNSAPGDVTITKDTTAVSGMLGLRTLAGDSIDPAPLIGCLEAGNEAAWQAPGFPFQRSDFDTVVGFINSALNFDQDPLRYLSYNRYTGAYLKTGTVFTLDAVSVTTGRIGAPVTLSGSGFNVAAPVKNVIRFNGVQVPTSDVLVNPNGTRLDVHVPLGATTGPISLEIDGTMVAGSRFVVLGGDGHDVFDDQGRMLVVSQELGTLSRVALDGTVTTLVDSGLPGPRAVTYDRATKKLYVACYDGGLVVRFDMASGTPDSPVNWAVVPHAAGLAIGADGYLYVASHDEGKIARFDLATGTPGSEFTGFDHPVGLGVDFLGLYLYVAEQGAAKKVTRVTLANGGKTTWAYVDTPWGLAVDSGGNVFVSANTGDAVLKIAPPTATRPTPSVEFYASLPSPTGLDLDEAGTLYVGDRNNARLLRITSNGGVYPFAYGVSSSNGYAIDASNNRFVALSNVNAILKVSPDGKTTQPFAVGIANPAGLTYRNGYLFASHPETGGVTRFDAQGRASSYGQGIRGGNTGLDVAPDGTVWANKYASFTNAYRNPQRGYDQDTNWWFLTGMMRVPENGTATDNFNLLNAPHSIAARGGILYLITADKRLVKATPTVLSGYSLTVLDATLTNPIRVSLDKDGNPLVSDNDTGKVYRYTVAAGYARSQVGNDLPGVYGIAANQTDNTLYAATNPGNKLYVLTAGTWTEIPLSSALDTPCGIAVAPNGSVVAVADYGSGTVKTVALDGTVTSLPKPNSRPRDVDFQTTGLILASCNTGSIGALGVVRYDATRTILTELYNAYGYDTQPMGVDRTNNKVYTACSLSWLRVNGANLASAPRISGGEVLYDASGVYCATPDGVYKYGLSGNPDLYIKATKPMGMVATQGAIYFGGGNLHLYQITDPSTGAWARLTTLPLPDYPLAMDARTDGTLEFVSGSDPHLYQVSADKTTATIMPIGLRRPEF